MDTRPTEPEFIRDGLFTRCVCPFDGTAMHVAGDGYWTCTAGLHRWHRFGHCDGQAGAWKLLRTF